MSCIQACDCQRWRAGGGKSLSQCCPFRLRASTLIVGHFSGTYPPLSDERRLDCHCSAVRDPRDAHLAASIRLSLRVPCAAPAHFHASSDALTVAHSGTTKTGNLEEEEEGGGGRRVCLIWQGFFFLQVIKRVKLQPRLSWWLLTNYTLHLIFIIY